MPQIAPDSLLSLEAYARERNAYRSRVIAHKKLRTVHVGEHVTLIFEDEQTVRYQVQEMLRIERIFEEEGIRGELEAYNPLIPDGGNWKATLLIEYPEPEERRRRLAELKGIEDRCWVQVEGEGQCARCSPSPTRTSSARTRRRPRRCISSVSSSTRACAPRSSAAPPCRSASIIRITGPARRWRPRCGNRWRATWLEAAVTGLSPACSPACLRARPSRPRRRTRTISMSKARLEPLRRGAGEARTGRRPRLALPPYPKDADLIEFQVSSGATFRFFIDAASLSVGTDGVVRYTLVARSPSGAANVSFEGIRCSTQVVQGVRAGDGRPLVARRRATWRDIEAKTIQRWHNVLYCEYLCPRHRPIETAAEGVNALRRGVHPGLAPAVSGHQPLEQDQIVPVDQFGFVDVAEDGFDFR